MAGEPDLASAVAAWEDEIGEARHRLPSLAASMARPGPVDPVRTARHLAAAGLSRALRLPARLASDLRGLRPVREPQAWVRSTGIEAFADQLALGGAATAEVARLIVAAGRLFPDEMVAELRTRGISPPKLEREQVEQIAMRVFPDLTALGPRPITSVPISQLHPGRLQEGRQVAVRVRRPGVARQLLADSRLFASLALPAQQLTPQLGALQPTAFVQLTTRQHLEAIDLRFEALGAVELGLAAEDLKAEGLTVSRPVAGRADERVLLSELVPGVPMASPRARPDPEALRAICSITIESALVHGVFWADPAPEHLLVRPDGTLVLAGCGSVGHLSPELRLAGALFLRSVLSGDAEGQAEAMRRAGAVPEGANLDRLVEDLGAAEKLKVSTMLMGGEGALLAGLNEAVRLLLQHHLQPPLEVALLLRTVFSLGALADRMAPGDGGLMAALLPLFQRLPELLEQAERAAGETARDTAGGASDQPS